MLAILLAAKFPMVLPMIDGSEFISVSPKSLPVTSDSAAGDYGDGVDGALMAV